MGEVIERVEIIRRNTDYGIRALVYLALNPGVMVGAPDIAEKQEVPIEYLHKIMQKFVRSGLVDSHRGVQGGFSLAKPPEEIQILEVVEILQGKLHVNKCFLAKGVCSRSPECQLKQNWLVIQNKLTDMLKGITIKDLADQLRDGDK